MFAKAIGNERLKRNIFDANKPLGRQRAFSEQIKRGGVTVQPINQRQYDGDCDSDCDGDS